MNHFEDTIASIATPVGMGGIGIVRISGADSIKIAEKIFVSRKKGLLLQTASSHTLYYGFIKNPLTNRMIDEVLLSIMRAPNSYTKEDVVEINCHGGIISVKKILETVLGQGARLAMPGEFTKRAFLNGRINLAQAEAVQDLITAKTEESMRIALDQLKGSLSKSLDDITMRLTEVCAHVEAYIDFPEEEIELRTLDLIKSDLCNIKNDIAKLAATYTEARFFREGLSVAIVGRPNVGKSSLLNSLLMKDRAIVTELPGTTRDIIEDYLNINGLPVRIIDTAGIRASEEIVEKEGIKRSLYAIENADFIIAMFDGSEPLQQEDYELLNLIADKRVILTINKHDKYQKIEIDILKNTGKDYIYISALTGSGIDKLKDIIFHSNIHGWEEEREGVIVTNLRHKLALERACRSIENSINAIVVSRPLEILAIELRDALDAIGEINGTVTADDILDKIFSEFCIGK